MTEMQKHNRFHQLFGTWKQTVGVRKACEGMFLALALSRSRQVYSQHFKKYQQTTEHINNGNE
jgi:hypothetical protein